MIDYTALLPSIQKHLQKCQTRTQLQEIIFDQPLILAGLYISSDLVYVTDLRHSIQLMIQHSIQSQPIKYQALDPNNSMQSKYYKIINKKWHMFNCNLKYITPFTKQPLHPYQPQFYFKDEYRNFLEQKQAKNSYNMFIKAIKIDRWRFKIVNVSGTGWYAPTIEPIQTTVISKQLTQNLQYVSCIMYQPLVRQKMQKFRLNDWRSKKVEMPLQHNLSILFHSRFEQKQYKISNNNSFKINSLKIDRQQSILKNTNKSDTKYVLWGVEAKGAYALTQPIDTIEIDQRKIYQMTLDSMKNLFKQKSKQKLNKNQRQGQLWSSQDQNEEQPVKREESMESQEQSSSSSQDPLRQLYRRRLEQQHRDGSFL